MRYAVRKVRHRWAVCAGRLPLLEFDDFEEALHVARNAALILSQGPAASGCEQIANASRRHEAQPSSMGGGDHNGVAPATSGEWLADHEDSIEIHQIDDRQIAVLR